MSNKWTKEQLEAINLRNKNLLVSAAAGSGKTAVLVERIANLIEIDRENIESMLIVTFTNAAARQMKDRIQKKLQERMLLVNKNDEDFEEKTTFLRTQIKNISRASISTVHSFCIDILRRNFQKINIDPSFKIANESLVSILKNKALEEVFEENYESENLEFLRLVDAFGGEKSDKGLVEIINQGYYFIQAQPYPFKWLESQIVHYDFEDFEESIWADEILRHTLPQLEDIICEAEKAIELCKTYSPPLAYIENIEDDKIQIESIIGSLNKKDFENYFQKLTAFKQSRLKIISKKAIETNQYDEAIIEEIKDIRSNIIKEEMKAISKAFGDTPFSQLIEDIKYMKPYVESLAKLIKQFSDKYSELKTEKGVLDFSDIEHYTLKVLEDENIQQNLSQKYNYIFFDEYQDSNLVQETIIESIKRNDNLFFVGDVKQSIYRFRLSDPNLFNQRYQKYSKKEEVESEKIDLSRNFRSRSQILDFCNIVFENIMTVEHGEVDYSNKSNQLIAGKVSDEYDDNIELTVIEKKSKNDDEDIPENDEIEAVYCAQKIQELISKNIEYKDIAILMRSPKGKAKTFEKIFSKYNIPCYVDFQSSSFSKIEIKCILDYLRIIENQNQDEALLGAMTSAFGNFEIKDIIEIRIAYQNEKFHEATKKYAKEKTDEIAENLNHFYNRIQEYRFLEKMWKLSDFIGYIIEDTNYMTYISGMQDSSQRLNNIKSFIEKAREYEVDENWGLFGFLRQIDKILKEKGDSLEKTTLAEAENAVTIMSIHKSKGLEYNTVFLCDLGKKINEIDLRSEIILHNELGIGMKYKNIDQNIQSDSIPRNYIKLRKSMENISEEIRILYVALTRAIDRLYMVGSVGDIEKFKTQVQKGNISQIVKKQKNYLSWIAGVLSKEVKYNEKLNVNYIKAEEIKTLEQEIRNDKEVIKHKILNYKNQDIETDKLFEKVSDFEYIYQKDVSTPSKKTVTELTKSYKIEEEYSKWDIKLNKIPKFLQIENTLSKTEIGTVTHMIMEKISIKAHDISTIEIELKDMVSREILTEEEKNAVNIHAIEKFFSSDIGKRMINAREIYREKSFLMKLEDIIVEGIIDCFFIENDGNLVLIDYKTDKEISVEKYKAQLKMYQRALEQTYKTEISEVYIYWLSHEISTPIH